MLIDATTADPMVTRKIGADLEARGVAMLDAALGRTPKEAEAGKLSTYVGGDAAVLARVRPILETYADTIVHCGGLGAGTTCKLVNNSITIGMAALFAEGFATAAKVGADLNALCDVLSAGGADGRMWRMLEPWIRSGDDSHLRGPIRIAAKDVRTYSRMADERRQRHSHRPVREPDAASCPQPGPCRRIPAGTPGHFCGAQWRTRSRPAGADDLRGALTDDQAGQIGIVHDGVGENARIGHHQIVDAVN